MVQNIFILIILCTIYMKIQNNFVSSNVIILSGITTTNNILYTTIYILVREYYHVLRVS